jgi:hypothetical protein
VVGVVEPDAQNLRRVGHRRTQADVGESADPRVGVRRRGTLESSRGCGEIVAECFEEGLDGAVGSGDVTQVAGGHQPFDVQHLVVEQKPRAPGT